MALKEIFDNHVKKFLSVNLMNTNSRQNMNNENKYTIIMPLVGHPSIIFKTSLAKNFKSSNKKCCTISKTIIFQNYFCLKDETPLALQSSVVYLCNNACGNINPILVTQKDICQLGLRSIFPDVQPF